MVWILPTLNRPQQCASVVRGVKENGATTKGIVFVNGKELAQEYWDIVCPETPDGWIMDIREKNVGALGALNAVLEDYPEEPWYGFIGDDEFVAAEGFDVKLISAAGSWNVSHGDDGVHAGSRAQGYVVVGGDLARAVGYLALPGCWHWYGFDEMWETLAANGACKKIFVPEVKVEHKHPYFGSGEMDGCYELGASCKDIDFQYFAHWLRHGMKEVVERVSKAKGEA